MTIGGKKIGWGTKSNESEERKLPSTIRRI